MSHPVLSLTKSLLLSIVAATGVQISASALANPEGHQVVVGEAKIDDSVAGQLTVRAGNGAIIEWKDFSIAPEERTDFFIRDGGRVLNRVVGGGLSTLGGELTADGTLYLINPNGITVGQGATIDTASLVLSTLNLSNDDFTGGTNEFAGGDGALTILRGGVINAKGNVALVGPQIRNRGAVAANAGNLILASGNSVKLSSDDFDFVSFEVPGTVNNIGNLVATNGAVGVFASSVTAKSGLIQAQGITTDSAGGIQLTADTVKLGGALKTDGALKVNGASVQIGGFGVDTNISSREIDLNADDSIRLTSKTEASLAMTANAGNIDIDAPTLSIDAAAGAPIVLSASNALNLVSPTRIDISGETIDLALSSGSGTVSYASPICERCKDLGIESSEPPEIVPPEIDPPTTSGNPDIPSAPAPGGLVVRPDATGAIVTALTVAVLNTLSVTPGIDAEDSDSNESDDDPLAASGATVADATSASQVFRSIQSGTLPQCN